MRDIEKVRAARRRWFEKNKSHQKAYQKERRGEITVWLRSLKIKCQRCSEDFVGCLGFHHRDPKQKEIVIARVVRNGWSKERILKEVSKCDVLCANCHMKEHYMRLM